METVRDLGLSVHRYIAIIVWFYVACDHRVCPRSKGKYHLHHSYILVRGKPRCLSEALFGLLPSLEVNTGETAEENVVQLLLRAGLGAQAAPLPQVSQKLAPRVPCLLPGMATHLIQSETISGEDTAIRGIVWRVDKQRGICP